MCMANLCEFIKEGALDKFVIFLGVLELNFMYCYSNVHCMV